MNEYAAVGGIGQTHDDNGNLTNDGSQRYSYDFANRLVRIRDDMGLTTARYAYDALGRRTLKVVGDEATSFFYDGARSIEGRNGTDSVTGQYVFGRGMDEVLQLTTNGQSSFYHDNSIGSLVALTDETGAVVERYRYQAYGENTILAADGITPLLDSTVGNPFRFTGRRFDNESGLYYYRARHYQPSRGRFLQRVPQGYGDGLGLYQYVGSNPVNFVDPWGLEKDEPFDWGPFTEKYADLVTEKKKEGWHYSFWGNMFVSDPTGTYGFEVFGDIMATADFGKCHDWTGAICGSKALADSLPEGYTIGEVSRYKYSTAHIAAVIFDAAGRPIAVLDPHSSGGGPPGEPSIIPFSVWVGTEWFLSTEIVFGGDSPDKLKPGDTLARDEKGELIMVPGPEWTAADYQGSNVPSYTGPPLNPAPRMARPEREVSGPDRDFTAVPVEPIG